MEPTGGLTGTARVLEYDEASRCHVLRLAHAPWSGRRVEVVLTTCTERACTCATLNFDCALWNPASEGGPAHLYFRLDLDERKSYGVYDREYTADARRLSKALLAELREEDWDLLFDHFFRLKRQMLEGIDPAETARSLRDDVLDSTLTLVRHARVFPFAYDFPFSRGTERWVVDDLYCAEPGCDCRGALLLFLRLPQPRMPWRRRVRGSDGVSYDYTTGVVEREHDISAAGTPLAELVAALKLAHPGLDSALAKRHEQLRAVLRHVGRRVAARRDRSPELSSPPSSPKVAARPNRNAPCPCGSGKKYKKCCGLLQAPGSDTP